MKALLLIFMLCGVCQAAADGDATHFAAHFGMGYAITGGMYGLFNTGFHWKPDEALLVSGLAVTLTTAVVQAASAPKGTPVNVGGLFQTVAGSAAFAITAKMFRWEINWEGQ